MNPDSLLIGKDDVTRLDMKLTIDGVQVFSGQDASALSKTKFTAQKNTGLLVRLDASHVGYVNDNFKFYRGAGAAKSLRSWTRPRNKPFLFNHNVDGKPLGTIVGAEMKQFSEFTDWSTDLKSNKPQGVLQLYARISDIEAAEMFIDGRYNAVSIHTHPVGGVYCSITNKNLLKMSVDERFDHIWKYRPGSMYDIKNKEGKVIDRRLCYWAYDRHNYVECSAVNIPGDGLVKVTGIELPSKDNHDPQFFAFDKEEELVRSVLEQKIPETKPFFVDGLVITDVREPETKPLYEEETSMKLSDILAREDVQDHISQVTTQAVKDAVTPVQTELDNTKSALAEKEAECDTLKETNVTLNQKSEDALTSMRNMLIGDVIDARIALGKHGTQDIADYRKQAEEDLAQRSTESLMDTRADLTSELAAGTPDPVEGVLPDDAGNGDAANDNPDDNTDSQDSSDDTSDAKANPVDLILHPTSDKSEK